MLSIPSRHIRVGDLARFPLGRLGEETVYPRSFEVVAFQPSIVILRRLHDGLERRVSTFWCERYALENRPTIADESFEERRQSQVAGLERIRRSKIAGAAHQTDPSKPGYYVSARKGPSHRLLLGPFADHYSALQLVRIARQVCDRKYDDPYCEVSYGTCRAETSERAGLLNSDVFTF